MNKLDRLLELYDEYRDSPHEPIRKDMKEKFDSLYLEIQQAIENQRIVESLKNKAQESLDIINEKRNDKDKFIHIPFTEKELQSILKGGKE